MTAITLNVIVQGVLTGLVYGLMALGLSVIFGVMRVVNFAHGEFTVVAMAWPFLTSNGSENCSLNRPSVLLTAGCVVSSICAVLVMLPS